VSVSGRELNLLGGYGPWVDAVASKAGRLSFRSTVLAGTLEMPEWKRRGRARVRELLGPLPAPEGFIPTVRTVSRSTRDGVDVEELSWELPYGPPTEAILLKPAGARGPLPGVLALHDHGGFKRLGGRKIADAGTAAGAPDPAVIRHRELYYGGAAWANELARRGFCVLVHDAFPFGSRRVRAGDVPSHVTERLLADPANPAGLNPDRMVSGRSHPEVDVDGRYEDFAAHHEDVAAKALFSLGYTLPGVTLADDSAALAVLRARPDVDPKRLGCCGLSGGGLRTCFLAGLDDSVACAVTAGFMSTWRDFALANAYTHTWGLFVPHLAREMDFPEILGLRAPLPSLVIACDEDLLFDQDEVKKAEVMHDEIYRSSGAAERMRTSHYPRPHSFDTQMQAEAFDWLGRWLGSPRGG
jgi:dienelactone hydrolase